MRLSTFSGLLAATILATSGVLAQYDDENSGALTARDVFEDDLLQERSFDDLEDYEARDYLDDELDARDIFEDEFDARDFDDEFDARDFADEDFGLEARRRGGGLKSFGRKLGNFGKKALSAGVQGAVSSFAPGLAGRGYDDEDEWLVARTKYASKGTTGRTGGAGTTPNRERKSDSGANGPSRSTGRGGLSGRPPASKGGFTTPGFRPTGLGRGGAGLSRGGQGLSRGGQGLSRGGQGLSRGGSGLSRGGSGLSRGGLTGATGRRSPTLGNSGVSKGRSKKAASVEAREFLEDLLEARGLKAGGPGGPGAQGARRKKINQRKRLRNKLRKQKAAAAAAEPAAEAAPAAPEARDFEVDELD